MAATVIVELTGDERKVLESYRKAEEADRKLRESTGKTGDAGKAASKEFTDAWLKAGSGAIAGVDKLIGELKRIGPEGAAAATAIDDHFREVGKNGKQSMQEIIDRIGTLDDAAGKAAAQAAEKIKAELAEADRSAEFRLSLESLRMLGPEGAETAKAIQRDMEQAGAASKGSFSEILAKITEMRPEAATTAARIKMEFESAAKQADFKETLAALKRLGPEGDKIATGVAKDMDRAAALSVGSIDEIIQKMHGIDTAAAQAAERIKIEIATADAQTTFDRSITQLQKINPEAAKAAFGIREKMDLADASVRFDNILEELRKVDPVAAAEAAKMRGHMLTATNDSTGAFKSFAESSIGQFTSIAGAVGLVGGALKSVNEYLEAQAKLTVSAMEKQGELAAAQQESFKNLAAYKAFERDELLQKAAPEIARRTGVSNPIVALALGEAASAGATPEQAILAAGAAAEMNRHTPDKVAAYSGGIASVMIQTGLKDPREASALLATAGPLSKVSDASKLAVSLPQALGMVSTVPNQAPGEAAREIAALYGVGTNRSVDETGLSTATFIQKLLIESMTMFTDLENKRIDARSKVDLIDRKIDQGASLEEIRSKITKKIEDIDKKIVAGKATPKDADNRTGFVKYLEEINPEGKSPEEKKKIEQQDLKLQRGKATEANVRDRLELLQFLKETEGMKDPGTISGRVEAIRNNEGMQKELIGKSGQMGEQKFQVFLTELFDANSQSSQSLRDMTRGIRSDRGYFDETVAAMKNATPQLRGETFVKSGEVSIETSQITDIEAARLAQLRTRVSKELKQADVGGFGGFVNSLLDQGLDIPLIGQTGGINLGSLSGGTFAEEAVNAIATIRTRIGTLNDGGVTPQEKIKIEQLQFAVKDITELLTEDAKSGSITSSSLTAALSEIETFQKAFSREGLVTETEFYQKLSESLTEAMTQRMQAVVTSVPLDIGNKPIAMPLDDRNVTVAAQPTGQVSQITTEYPTTGEPALVSKQIDATNRVADAIERQTASIERQTTIVESQSGILAETADNTRPSSAPPLDYNSIQTESLQQQDADE